MANRNTTQVIWIRNDREELVLNMPKVISSDVSYQLMFGMKEDTKEERRIIRENDNKYSVSIYEEKELKLWFL